MKEFPIQAEVDKNYQGVPFVPDLLFHVPGGRVNNLAILEFKLDTNIRNIQDDLFKLQYFKLELGYHRAFTVVIGGVIPAETVHHRVEQYATSSGCSINLIVYNRSSQTNRIEFSGEVTMCIEESALSDDMVDRLTRWRRRTGSAPTSSP